VPAPINCRQFQKRQLVGLVVGSLPFLGKASIVCRSDLLSYALSLFEPSLDRERHPC
jgi:hypothetical protein